MRTRDKQIYEMAERLAVGVKSQIPMYQEYIEREFAEVEKRVRDQIENKNLNALYTATRNTFRHIGNVEVLEVFDREYKTALERNL